MMYEFLCPDCKRKTTHSRAVADRDNKAECPFCSMEMRRVFSPPIINCNMLRDRPENKWGLGNSEREIAETMKADDKTYNDHWDGKWKDQYANAFKEDIKHETIDIKPVTPMIETMKKMGIPIG